MSLRIRDHGETILKKKKHFIKETFNKVNVQLKVVYNETDFHGDRSPKAPSRVTFSTYPLVPKILLRLRDNIFDLDHGEILFVTELPFDFTIRKALLADGDAHRRTPQVGVLELHTRAFVAVVHEHVDTTL